MRIVALTVCVNYADILAITLPHNLAEVDELVVVWDPGDRETERVLLANAADNLTHKASVSFREQGPMNLGKMLNVGLDVICEDLALTPDTWILHLDADMTLPPGFKGFLEWTKLQPDCLYGADRCNVHTLADWIRFKTCREGPLPMPRLALAPHGYIPCGAFQMWHAIFRDLRFGEEHPTAAWQDVEFALRWPREKRVLIPEVMCLHLEPYGQKLGVNWSGRESPRFT